MDFALSEQQQQIYDELARFARDELREPLRAAGPGFYQRGWRMCAELDLFGLAAPAAHGGCGYDAVTCAAALEALGYGCEDNGFLFSVGVQILAGVAPLCDYGSDAQRAEHLGPLLEGRAVAAFCASETGAGSDLLGLRTRATPRGDEVLLDGSKAWVTNAPAADLLLVLARDEALDESVAPLKRLSVYLVERGRPGLEVGPPQEKLGLDAAPMAEVFLEGCAVPRDSRLGPAGAGYTIFSGVMQRERVLLPAIYLGVMRAQLERTCAHARRRRQFDRPLDQFQAVGHALAEMKARLEASRLLVYRAAWELARGRQAALEGALAKLVASESFQRNSQQALQLHGAYGYTREAGLERQLRDAAAATIYSGTSEIQRTIIARLLACPDRT